MRTVGRAAVAALMKSDHGRHLVTHVIQNYEEFIDRQIEQAFNGYCPIVHQHNYVPSLNCYEITVELTFSRYRLAQPQVTEMDVTRVMTPDDARKRGLTYEGKLHADMEVKVTYLEGPEDNRVVSETHTSHKGVNIGMIPIMVGSKYCVLSDPHAEEPRRRECSLDHGGYFIVSGSEKVLISSDRVAENRICAYREPGGGDDVYVETRTVLPDHVGPHKQTVLKFAAQETVFGRAVLCQMYHVRSSVNVFVVFRALGVETDEDIVSIIFRDKREREAFLPLLEASARGADGVRTQREALNAIAAIMQMNSVSREFMQNIYNRVNLLMNQVLGKNFLTNADTPLQKALFLGAMTRKLLLCSEGVLPLDDRDSFVIKKVDILLNIMFRKSLAQWNKQIKRELGTQIQSGAWRSSHDYRSIVNRSNISKIVRPSTITTSLRYNFSTGRVMQGTNKPPRTGVSQILNRSSGLATTSHLRRVEAGGLNHDGRLVGPRGQHNTQYGVMCPCETPEGGPVGLIKNLAIGVRVSPMGTREVIHRALARAFVRPVPGTVRELSSWIEESQGTTEILVCGDLRGVTSRPEDTVAALRAMKMKGEISVYTSIAWRPMQGVVLINTEAGRCCRPLFVVSDGRTEIERRPDIMEKLVAGNLDWESLVTDPSGRACVEFIDPEEADCALIAQDAADLEARGRCAVPLRFTHMEIDPSLILGVVAANIPFPDHNQSPRNSYQSSMGKQAIGVPTTAPDERWDTSSPRLDYAARPIVCTAVSRALCGSSRLPYGFNAVVAIAAFSGFNQEDSLIINASAVQRGLFNVSYFRTVREELGRNHSTGEKERFGKPTNPTRSTNDYSLLGDDGIARVGGRVYQNSVVIGKVLPTKDANPDRSFVHANMFTDVDKSRPFGKTDEYTRVEAVAANNRPFYTVNESGSEIAKVRLLHQRAAQLGDKFSSRAGQKGTVGIARARDDMPYAADGLQPDLIMNPHAIPSRMTVAQIMESMLGTACAARGSDWGNGSPFSGVTVEGIARHLVRCGLSPYGTRVLYDPRTGREMTADIFVGITYYQRLSHFVTDKLHNRDKRGSKIATTRQPSEGRSRGGGLRLGEMECNTLVAHSAEMMLKERLVECSDKYSISVCTGCNRIGFRDANTKPYCMTCSSTPHADPSRNCVAGVTYVFKLWAQELMACGIGLLLETETR